MIKIREMKAEDCMLISLAFKKQNWDKPVEQYQQYLFNQKKGLQSLYVAFIDNIFVGYLVICWHSTYHYFNEQNIPEIIDLNVLEEYQQRGIASQLLDYAEKQIFKNFEVAGIGVGLTEDYGKAQRLYIKRGYLPDGRGLMKNNHPVSYGQSVEADDDLVLYFTKTLK